MSRSFLFTTPSTMEQNRRRFLSSVAGVAGLAATSAIPATEALAAPDRAPGEDAFKLGVASGDPTATGVVLWTRLVPLPFEPGGGMPGRPVTVSWQVARDALFRHVVRSGEALALPQLAHSVHVDVDGLTPDRDWYYRF